MKQLNGGNVYRPTGKEKNLQAILNIHRHVIQNISPVTITAGKTLDIKIDNQSHILLITKGAIKVCRRIDSIVMGCGVSPMILGLVDAYADLYQLEENSDVFFIAETTCEYYPVPVKDFVEIADEKHLWRDISNILMYRIAFMTNRDRNLIGQDAYSQIKALLLELWSYPESSRFEIKRTELHTAENRAFTQPYHAGTFRTKSGGLYKNTAWKTVRASKPAGFILNGQASYTLKNKAI